MASNFTSKYIRFGSWDDEDALDGVGDGFFNRLSYKFNEKELNQRRLFKSK